MSSEETQTSETVPDNTLRADDTSQEQANPHDASHDAISSLQSEVSTDLGTAKEYLQKMSMANSAQCDQTANPSVSYAR